MIRFRSIFQKSKCKYSNMNLKLPLNDEIKEADQCNLCYNDQISLIDSIDCINLVEYLIYALVSNELMRREQHNC